MSALQFQSVIEFCTLGSFLLIEMCSFWRSTFDTKCNITFKKAYVPRKT